MGRKAGETRRRREVRRGEEDGERRGEEGILYTRLVEAEKRREALFKMSQRGHCEVKEWHRSMSAVSAAL